MKKTILIILLCLFVTAGLFAARTRAYTQKVIDPNSVLSNQQFPDVTCTSTQTAPGYVVNAWIVSRPTEVTSTLTHVPGAIRLYRFGNGTTVPYDTRVFVQFANFTTDWAAGDVLHVQVINNNVSPALDDYWELPIPNNLGSAITITDPIALDLWPADSDTWTYNLQVNGPAGTAVTGPGTYAGTLPQLFTCPTEVNDLLGNWTAGEAPSGFYWQTNPILVQASDFVGAKADHVYNATIEFVALPIPDTYTLHVTVTGPSSLIIKNGVSTGVTSPHDFTGAAAADLIGVYSMDPAGLPSGNHWEPAYIEVVAADFTASKSGLVTLGTLRNGAKVAYAHSINFTQVIDPLVIVPVDPATLPTYPAGNVVAAYQVTGTGTHSLFIARNDGDTSALAYIGGSWFAPDGTPDWTWQNVNFDSKATISVVVYGPNIVIPDAPVLSISMSGTSATLSWPACTGASNYRIEYSSDPYSSYTMLATTSSLSYTHTDIGSSQSKVFYRVAAQSGRVESAPSNVVGYVKYDCVPGLNMIALPLEIPWEWVSEFGSENSSSIESIYCWNTAAQTWVGSTDLGECWDGDFTIHTNDALFISNTSATSLFVCGRLPAAPAQFSLVAGINAIVIPLSISQLTMASILGEYIESLDSIFQWDNLSQAYNVTYDFGDFWDMDFAIETGFPLLVNSLYALSWPTRSSDTVMQKQDK